MSFESCVWRAVVSHSPHYPHGVILVQFSLYVNKVTFIPSVYTLVLPTGYFLYIYVGYYEHRHD